MRSPAEDVMDGRLWNPAVAAMGSLADEADACHWPSRLAESSRAAAIELRAFEEPELASTNCFNVFHSLHTWHWPDHCTAKVSRNVVSRADDDGTPFDVLHRNRCRRTPFLLLMKSIGQKSRGNLSLAAQLMNSWLYVEGHAAVRSLILAL